MPSLRGIARRMLVAIDRRSQRTVTVRGLAIAMSTPSERARERVRAYATKEPATLDWIDRVLRPGDVFYDVGANIGQYGIYAALRQPDVRAYLFEPHGANAANARENLHLNGLTECQVLTYAVGAERHHAKLSIVGEGEVGSAMHTVNEESGQAIAVVPLDEVAGKDLPFPNHLKIDVDGYEMSVLQGARATLADPRLRSVLVEVEPAYEEAALAIFRDAGLAQSSSAASGGAANLVFERTGPTPG